MSQTQKMSYFEKKCLEIKTNIFVPLWLSFITLLLKYKPVEKNKPILETWNANDLIVNVWIFILR